MEHKVERFGVKGNTLQGRSTVLDIPREDGLPDGMTIDQNGNLWLALWGGWGVVCIDPDTRRIVHRTRVSGAPPGRRISYAKI